MNPEPTRAELDAWPSWWLNTETHNGGRRRPTAGWAICDRDEWVLRGRSVHCSLRLFALPAVEQEREYDEMHEFLSDTGWPDTE